MRTKKAKRKEEILCVSDVEENAISTAGEMEPEFEGATIAIPHYFHGVLCVYGFANLSIFCFMAEMVCRCGSHCTNDLRNCLFVQGYISAYVSKTDTPKEAFDIFACNSDDLGVVFIDLFSSDVGQPFQKCDFS